MFSRRAHKTRTHKRDGYKAHIATEPESGLVTAVALTPANTPDADIGTDLVAEEPPGTHIVADSAYASGAALETFDNKGHIAVVKPIVRKPRIKHGYHRDDFDIDTGARTVTCPARHTTRIRRAAAPLSPSGATAAPCAAGAPPRNGDAPSQSTDTTTSGPLTRPAGPKTKPSTPTEPTGRP